MCLCLSHYAATSFIHKTQVVSAQRYRVTVQLLQSCQLGYKAALCDIHRHLSEMSNLFLKYAATNVKSNEGTVSHKLQGRQASTTEIPNCVLNVPKIVAQRFRLYSSKAFLIREGVAARDPAGLLPAFMQTKSDNSTHQEGELENALSPIRCLCSAW